MRVFLSVSMIISGTLGMVLPFLNNLFAISTPASYNELSLEVICFAFSLELKLLWYSSTSIYDFEMSRIKKKSRCSSNSSCKVNLMVISSAT